MKRRGISLLEVLVAIFVVMTGLLGVMALIPVGQSQQAKSQQADASRDLGAAALRNLQVQGWIDPSRWCFADGSTFDATSTGTTAFVIDPLGAERGNPAVRRFPTGSTLLLPRLSVLNGLPTPSMLTRVTAERFFVSTADMIFATDGEGRPEAVLDPHGQGIAWKGEYSWLATVNPSPAEHLRPYSEKTTWGVSVVVFRNRDFAAPIATASVSFFGDGTHGGDATLTFATQEDIPQLRPNTWLALHSPEQVSWYRIVHSSADPDEPLDRLVMLTGPDWQEWAPGGVQAMPATAIIPKGVVGVYTTTIKD